MFSVILKEHNFLGVIITGKIKKILCLGLATVLAVGMTACGTKSAGDVYKLYKNGINSINNAVGIDLTTDTTMLATVGEESNETGYSSTLKKQNKDGDKQDTSITVSQSGQNYTTEYLIDGSKAYVIIQDQYQTLQPAQVIQNTGYNKLYADFEADAVTNTTTEKKDGKTVYKMELDPSKAGDFVAAHLEGYMLSTEQMDIQLNSISVSVIFGKKNIPSEITYSYSLAATQKASSDGSTTDSTVINLDTTSVYKVNAIGDSVSFDLPDISSLTEYQDSISGGTGATDGSTGTGE